MMCELKQARRYIATIVVYLALTVGSTPATMASECPPSAVVEGAPTPEKLASSDSEQEVSPRGADTALRVLLDGEATASWDGGTWFGGKAGIGFGLGRIIIGGVFRFSIDTKLTGPGRQYDTHRVAYDGLVFIGIPIKWSRVALIPGVDIGGGGVRRYERIEDRTVAENDDFVINQFDGGARLGGHLSLDIPLKWGFGLNVDLSFCVSLPAERDVITREGYPLAGEPLGNTRLGFGVRYDYPLGRKRRGT